MPSSLLPLLAGIIVLGVSAQWLAWRVGLPAILLLLLFGIVVGPVTGKFDPDAVFGELLLPIVSLSVALILYEGGLTLRMSELRRVGAVVRNLVSVGALVTWAIASVAAHFVLNLNVSMSVLLGAVLIVTGPTVISPLLRHIRPTGAVGPVLKWEGIVIDPIGALLAVLVFEAIVIGEAKEATMHVALGVAKTILIGGGLGLAAAAVFTIASYRHWIADHLENAVSFMLVVIVFCASNHFQHESGLLAVIVMGFALANQKWVGVEHLLEFKENLRVLLISSLFIVLAARVDLADLTRLAPRGLLFVGVLVLIARPLGVFLATTKSNLNRNERLFLAWMAPRGIVAAAVASVFAIRLEELGYAPAGTLVSITMFTIVVTVAVYGLTAPFVARRLGLAESNPQGLLFVGADAWVRELAAVLQREGFRVLIVDSNRDHTYAARMAEVPTYTGSILAEHTLDEIELGGIGRLLTVTPNDWVNVLAVRRFERIFGKANCYQLSPQQDATGKKRHKYLHGRWLFDESLTHAALHRHMAEGFTVKATLLSDDFDYAALLAQHNDSVVPLFIINEHRNLEVITPESGDPLRPGQTVISLVQAKK